MESNSNKTLQQKTFNKKTHEKVHTNPKTNVSLTQKTFKQQGAGGKVKKNTTYAYLLELQRLVHFSLYDDELEPHFYNLDIVENI